MKKTFAIIVSLSALGGCNQISMLKPDTLVQEAKPVEANPNVQIVSDLMLQVAPSSLKNELLKITEDAGLSLDYRAEPFIHKRKGTLTGSVTLVAQQLGQGLPVRVFRAGNTIIVEQVWEIRSGLKLKDQLKRWDNQSIWSVAWETQTNQMIQANAYFYGFFDEAVEQLFKAVRNDGSELEPEFYSNNTVVIR